MNDWSASQIKQFVEAILDEKDRALAMADNEREKAAAALRGEQQRALDQAGRERDKAAENLRIELARAIKEGDDRLREHISNQIQQIREALVSAEKLEVARIAVTDQRVESVAREIAIASEASAEAIEKAEKATEKRFESVNEFRAQLADQTTTFAPREVVEPRLTALEKWQAKTLGAIALAAVFVPLITGIAVYLLTRNAIPVGQ